MSVHDNFFLPGDDDSVLHQGVGRAEADPQVFEGNSLAGSLQGSLVGTGRDLGGGARPPPNQGHVPSHVSVATVATLVVATSGYFGANLQSEYAGNLAKIKNFKRHMDAWD